MTAGLFSANQFSSLVETWWERWHGEPLLKRLQSQTGVFVRDGASIVAIAYLYPTVGSEMIYLGFTVRDPNLDSIRADEALKLLLVECEHAARALGYSIIQSTFESKAMRSRVAEAGYVPAGETQLFVKELETDGKRS